MTSQHEEKEARYFGAERGVVVSNADPLEIGRVKVRLPGLHDETDWMLPLGGGSAQRGVWHIPKVGADVTIWFHRGDPNGYGFYLPGNWGTAEAPSFIKNDATITPETAPQLTGVEDDRYTAVLDNRDGVQRAVVTDKVSGDFIELDGKLRRVTVKATGTVSITGGQVVITGARVVINGRVIAPFGGPI
jgi:Type VI secretion system/phage-baseplate injector OB domain